MTVSAAHPPCAGIRVAEPRARARLPMLTAARQSVAWIASDRASQSLRTTTAIPAAFAWPAPYCAGTPLAGDIHERVAHRLLREELTPVLDVGCGEGELARHLPDGSWIGLDSSAEILARAAEPAVQGDACALPFPDDSYGSVALLYDGLATDPGLHIAAERWTLRPPPLAEFG
jgi:SAM-dependent methyltransferase